MSAPGTNRTNRDVRVESAFGVKAEVGFERHFAKHPCLTRRQRCEPAKPSDLPVVPICRNPTALISTANHRHFTARPVPPEGRLAIVRKRGAGCGGRFGAFDEWRIRRTAKACGPDAPTLASSLVDTIPARRRGQESPVPEESAI